MSSDLSSYVAGANTRTNEYFQNFNEQRQKLQEEARQFNEPNALSQFLAEQTVHVLTGKTPKEWGEAINTKVGEFGDAAISKANDAVRFGQGKLQDAIQAVKDHINNMDPRTGQARAPQNEIMDDDPESGSTQMQRMDQDDSVNTATPEVSETPLGTSVTDARPTEPTSNFSVITDAPPPTSTISEGEGDLSAADLLAL